jgi:hypothetical protein
MGNKWNNIIHFDYGIKYAQKNKHGFETLNKLQNHKRLFCR